tara:strand:+ start:166 stop:615 length:450 start_codon:yes stop_codon:yes gene_type:complete
MKKMIIAYRVLVALGVVLFLIGLANLALDYQLGSFQLLSILLATGGIVCTGFASIMVDDCKIRAKTAWHKIANRASDYKINTAVAQTNEEIDEEVTAFLQDSPNLSPESKEVWRGAITEGARAERDERCAKDLQYLARLIRKGEKGFNK